MSQGFLVHARTVIAHGNHDIITGIETDMVPAIGFIKKNIGGLNGDLPNPFDGIPGIDAQVCKNLVHLGGIDLGRPESFPHCP